MDRSTEKKKKQPSNYIFGVTTSQRKPPTSKQYGSTAKTFWDRRSPNEIQ